MIPFPKKKYNIIYADPPWTFKTYSEKGAEHKSAKRHYNLMSLDEIKALPVADIADGNCVLFLWATMPNLPEAFEVIKAWGFEYKTCPYISEDPTPCDKCALEWLKQECET